jgi:hypothetical protein
MDNQNNNTAEPFGPVIYTYTRSQAIADGFQVEVSKVAREAGITYPVFLTRAVYDSFVIVPPGVKRRPAKPACPLRSMSATTTTAPA